MRVRDFVGTETTKHARPTGIFLKCRVVNARNVGLGLQLDSCDGKPFAKLFQLLFDLLVLFWWFNLDRLFELLGCVTAINRKNLSGSE